MGERLRLGERVSGIELAGDRAGMSAAAHCVEQMKTGNRKLTGGAIPAVAVDGP